MLITEVKSALIFQDKLKKDQKAEAIKKVPGLLEIAAFTFLYSGTFVGPQFTLAKFRSFVDGAWLDEKKQPKQSAINASLRRFLGGAAFLILNLVGTAWIPNSYFNTPEYYVSGTSIILSVFLLGKFSKRS
ncbi:unnamed protein product [Haemonchus placei]|uniref:Lysophospholipid acyltransferase 5 n=1 Tax=Haemonchus placei TaxID=6290 RepID=A0A0N4WRC3_HAEPC|nr:unnamed protein product [Haemonchus placei]